MCSAIVNTYLGSQSVFAKTRKRFSKSRVRTFSWRSKVLIQGMSHFIYPTGHAQVSLRNGRYVLGDRKGMPRLFTKWSWLLSLQSSLGLDLVLYSPRWCVRKSNSWLNCTTFGPYFAAVLYPFQPSRPGCCLRQLLHCEGFCYIPLLSQRANPHTFGLCQGILKWSPKIEYSRRQWNFAFTCPYAGG